MDESIRKCYEAVARRISLNRFEPYFEIILPGDFNTTKPYDPEIVVRYTFLNQRNENTWIYEYEKTYVRQNKFVSKLPSHRSHHTCPACSHMTCNIRFINRSGETLDEPILICSCSNCKYEWVSKPDFLK